MMPGKWQNWKSKPMSRGEFILGCALATRGRLARTGKTRMLAFLLGLAVFILVELLVHS